MAIDDDSDEAAVGAEKSPRKVHGFIWAVLAGMVVLLALLLLLFHFHTPVVQHTSVTFPHWAVAA
jgi:hypothetical protein